MFKVNTLITGWLSHIMVKIIFDISKDEYNQLLKLYNLNGNINNKYADKRISAMCSFVIKSYLIENRILYPYVFERK